MKYLRTVQQCYSIITILVLVLWFDSGQGQGAPQTPCPEIFQYRFDGSEWIGILEFRGLQLGQKIKLNVNLSLKERLPTTYPGTLELFLTRQETLNNVIQNKPVLYRIRFPLPSPIPRVTQILFNNRVICSGPAEFGPLVTSIKLEHTLYTQLDAGQPLANQNPDPAYHIYGDGDHQGGTIQVQPQSDFDANTNFLPQQDYSYLYPTTTSVATQPPSESPRPERPSFPTFNPAPIRPTTAEPVVENQPQMDESAPLSEVCGNVDQKYNVRPLVVGGDEIERGSWPWLAAIYLNQPKNLAFACGGSLLSKKVVVTSAHCFFTHTKKYTASDVIVFLGRHNIRDWSEEGAVTASADGIFIHPDYKNGKSFDADLAVILLRRDVRFTEFIRPVCFWSEPDESLNIENQVGVVVGWGRNEAGQPVSSHPKRVEATVVSNLDCIYSNEQFRLLTSNRTFCAGNKNGEGPCTGDSGGGLMIRKNNKWYLRGTVSASILDQVKNTCDLNQYVIYGDAAKFVSWIGRFMYI